MKQLANNLFSNRKKKKKKKTSSFSMFTVDLGKMKNKLSDLHMTRSLILIYKINVHAQPKQIRQVQMH
jgi:hypothetical protein